MTKNIKNVGAYHPHVFRMRYRFTQLYLYHLSNGVEDRDIVKSVQCNEIN